MLTFAQFLGLILPMSIPLNINFASKVLIPSEGRRMIDTKVCNFIFFKVIPKLCNFVATELMYDNKQKVLTMETINILGAFILGVPIICHI